MRIVQFQRISWAFCLLVTGTLASVETNNDFVLLRRSQASAIRMAIQMNDKSIKPHVKTLRKQASIAMKCNSVSIVDFPAKNSRGTAHDYYSESPYWWPNPQNPNAPYIRRDGERNPDRFTAHKDALTAMCQNVLVLGSAAYFLDDSSYARKAVEFLWVWFIDEKTRMNPHLNFGQAIPNLSDGRAEGIIETRRLVEVVMAIQFLEETSALTPSELAALKRWFADYLYWMQTSKNGQKEKWAPNNHATWHAVQVAAFAEFVSDERALTELWIHAKNHLIAKQIQSNGACPAEEKRTRSLDYSLMNLDGFAALCCLAKAHGVDLWHYRARGSGSVQDAVAYMTPFIAHSENWTKKQITRYHPSQRLFLAFAGWEFENVEYQRLYRELEFSESDDMEPLMLIVNLAMIVKNQLKR